MTQNILFICGSLNQTTQLHQIALHLQEEFNCYFTPYYADGLERLAASLGLLNFTILGGRHQRDTRQYLVDHNLPIDERGMHHQYEMVVTCSDLIIQKNIRKKRIVLVQEGITEPESTMYHLYKAFPFLPRYIANTASTGLSNAYDVFCVASHGYAKHFMRKGVQPEKIVVTGIPNFDDLRKNYENDFPYKNYVLVATTPYRETFRYENRMAFLKRCKDIAASRPIIFKLHPIENVSRATREIRRIFPDALILPQGNVNHMIANAAVVITQQSSCTFVALALEKEIHTFLDVNELRHLMPIQNGGTSAQKIANIIRRLMHMPYHVLERIRNGTHTYPRWETDVL